MNNKSHQRAGLLVGLVVSMGLSASNVQAQDNAGVQFLNQPTSATPFSEAVRVGKTLYMSGQLGMVPGTPKLIAGGVAAETRQALENTKATLERYSYSLKDVVKCTVLLADIADFTAFNDVYLSFFARPYPARTLMAVKDLAFGARVEIECIAAKN